MRFLSAQWDHLPWRIIYFVFIAISVAFISISLAFPIGPRLFWTVAVAVLPLFIVIIGYNTWRNFCPLAFFTKLGTKIGLKKRFKLPAWFETNYYYITFGLLFISLAMRLLWINADITWLAGFLITTAFLAFLTGVFFTGKTWCSFICPVGVVEKIYCEPNNLQERPNSACQPCGACKKNCPDIDFEHGYWKEVMKFSKKFAYYAFPGLIIGFYVYYYLYSGTWSYYLSGDWTREYNLADKILSPGFFFWKDVPKLVAAPLTLLIFCLLSFFLFELIEKINIYRHRKIKNFENIRHQTLRISSFIAFNSFYAFAGRPTFQNYPAAYYVFGLAIMTLSALFLWKGFNRREKDYIQERFAKGFIKRWKWADQPIPDDLREVYVLATQREEDFKQRLHAYKGTVREIIRNGIAKKEDLQLLHQLRNQLSITEIDHERIISSLDQEDRKLFDPNYQHSIEKNLQLENYRTLLRNQVLSGMDNEENLQRLRQYYDINEEDHAHILHQITDKDEILWDEWRNNQHRVNQLRKWRRSLPKNFHIIVDYLKYSMNFEIIQITKRMIKLLATFGYGSTAQIQRALEDRDLVDIPHMLDKMRNLPTDKRIFLRTVIIENEVAKLEKPNDLKITQNEFIADQHLEDLIFEILENSQQNLFLITFYAASLLKNERLLPHLLQKINDKNDNIRQITTWGLKLLVNSEAKVRNEIEVNHPDIYQILKEPAKLNKELEIPHQVLLERMTVLRQVAIFRQLEPDDLSLLAEQAEDRQYLANSLIFSEGDFGNEVYVITEGDVEVSVLTENGKKVINTLGEGTCIGEIAVISGKARTATLMTGQNPVSMLVIKGTSFERILAQRPYVGLQVMKVMSERLLSSSNADNSIENR